MHRNFLKFLDPALLLLEANLGRMSLLRSSTLWIHFQQTALSLLPPLQTLVERANRPLCILQVTGEFGTLGRLGLHSTSHSSFRLPLLHSRLNGCCGVLYGGHDARQKLAKRRFQIGLHGCCLITTPNLTVDHLVQLFLNIT